MTTTKTQSLIQLALFIGVLFFINILGNAFFTYIDLTEDKRYSLTAPTQDLLDNLDEIVYVKVLLEGEFPAGFKRLQTATKEMLSEFNSQSSFVEYEFENPTTGTADEINGRRKELAKDGIYPTNLRVKDSDETTEKIIYPYAIFYYKGRSIPVNLLENEIAGMPPEIVLNNSVSLLEYKFTNAIQKLQMSKKPAIVFTKGHGELQAAQTQDLEKTLRRFYDTGRLNLDSVALISNEIDVLIVAKPTQPFSDKHKFKLDQYIMNGGKVIWLIDRLNATLDSLVTRMEYIPQERPLNLEDLLYRYGVRIQPNMILDLECTRIPLKSGQLGASAQMDKFNWYYHPIIAPTANHPIVKSLDRVNLFFPSSIDTVRTKTDIDKTILLQSSQYSRLQFPPTVLNFEILRYDPIPEKFNKPHQNVAVLLEGTFESDYKNKVTQSMIEGLKQLGHDFKSQSTPTKMIVVSDGDIVKNLITSDGQAHPLGYNRFERTVFGANKDFLINSIEYLMDKKGVFEARSKEVKLRLLDKVKAKNEKMKWRLINILIPLIFLLLFGFLYNFWRKRKYAN